MLKCGVCGFEVEKRKGLAMHVRMKHSMKLEDYEKQYGKVVESVVAQVSAFGGDGEEHEQENVGDVEVPILDWMLLPTDHHFFASYLDEKGGIEAFKRVVGLGRVQVENNVVIMSLVLDRYGSLYPASFLPNFDRIVEETPQQPSTGLKPVKKKRRITIKNPFAKKKRTIYGKYVPGLKSTEDLNKELIKRLSKYEDVHTSEE